MGCTGSDLNENTKLKFLLKKVKISSPVQIGKLKGRLDKQQLQLCQWFQKIKVQRNKPIEESIIQQCTFLSNMIHLWTIVQISCTKILDYWSNLQKSQTLSHISPQIQTLIFVCSILQSLDLSSISIIIQDKYNIKQPVMIDNQVANYHKKSSATSQRMRNQYVMSFSTQRNIQVQKINQVGHLFRYGV